MDLDSAHTLPLLTVPLPTGATFVVRVDEQTGVVTVLPVRS
ncbi:hypothetical protein DEI99_002120 [Curtobacterium sp. MCLR17_036]|nr:hypothetical protein [Curtobacterium sp. MCLR17_036]WIE65348.1 hypothetical protein DEI99_002120 [Curtobacterium sp. MCLR17_036]